MVAGVELATAYVSLAISSDRVDRDLKRTFKGAERSASLSGQAAGDQFAGGMSRSIASRAKAMFAPLAVGAGILGGLAAAGGKYGLEIAANNEQAQISFETMLGSADKASKFLGKLQKFAAETPFEFPELQTAASSLISIGIDADKVIPIMTTLGDVTSGMGTGSEGIKRATIALQQMNAAGRITAEDLNQLRDAGIPVYDLLAAATGKSKEEVAALAQKGKLGKKELTELMSALESGKGLERFSGLMDKQSQSLTGLLSSFKDTFGQGLATAIAPSIPLLKDGLGKATEYVGIVMPKVATGLQSVLKYLPTFGGVLAGIVTRVRSADFSPLTDFVDQIRSADYSGFTTLLSKIGPLAQDAASSLPAMSSAVGTASSVFAFMADHIDLVTAAMPYLLSAFAAYKALQIANNVVGRDSLVGFGLQIGSTIALVSANRALAKSQQSVVASQTAQTGAQTVGTATTLRQTIATAASTVASKVAAAASKAWAATQWLLNAALTANPIGLVVAALVAIGAGLYLAWTKSETFRRIVLAVWETVKTKVVAAATAVRDWVVNAWTVITSWTSTKWNQIRDAIAAAWAAVMTKVAQTVKWIKDVLSAAWTVVKSVASTAWSGITTAVSTAWALVTKPIVATANLVKSGLTTVWNLIKTGASTAWSGITTAISNVWDGLTGILAGPVDRAMQFIQENLIDKINGLFEFLNVSFRIKPIWEPTNTGFRNAGRIGTGRKLGDAAYASGGVLPGYSPGKDIHEFYSATGGRLMLSGGEAIMRPEFTRLIGGAQGVKALNDAARKGNLLPTQRFADGGVFGAISGAFSSIKDLASDPIGGLQKLIASVLNSVGSNPMARLTSAVVGKGMTFLVEKAKTLIGSMFGVGGIEAGQASLNGRRLDSDTARRITAAARASGVGMNVIQGSWSHNPLSMGTHAGAGAADLKASNWAGAVNALRSQGLLAMFRNWPGNQHIHLLNPHVNGLSPQALSQVRRAQANGGIFAQGGVVKPELHDAGRGIITPGTHVISNQTKRPEYLLSDTTLERMSGGGGRTVVQNINGAGLSPRELMNEAHRIERREAVLYKNYG